MSNLTPAEQSRLAELEQERDAINREIAAIKLRARVRKHRNGASRRTGEEEGSIRRETG